MIVFFRVEGTPRPKQSFKATSKDGKVRGYTPAIVKAWQNDVGWAAKQAMMGRPPMGGPLEVEIEFHLPDRRRRDLDNLSKAVLDAMNKIVFGDDQQIVRLQLSKISGSDQPHAIIYVARAKC